MDPIAVDIRLIKAVLGTELKIAPGRTLMARVVTADGTGRGSLNIAGTTLEAELPKDVQAGQELRLTVSHATPERVELAIVSSDQAAAATATSAPLPGGGTVRVAERDAGGGGSGGGSGSGSGDERHAVSLRYDAPSLGAVDLRFQLDPESLQVSAVLAPGAPVELAQDRAGQLQDALTQALGRPVKVDVSARYEPLDVYA
jgi:hypothetical protein